jgi:glycosyltransferase involved in cell wall biosynthesis
MRVAFDEQILLAQSTGGISRYFSELIATFRSERALGVDPILAWNWSYNQHILDLEISKMIPGTSSLLRNELLKRYAYYAANSVARHKINSEAILHYTFYHPRFLKAGYKGRRVVTIYDMTPEMFPEQFPGRNPHLAKLRYVNESDLVLCISKETAKDLLAIYGPLDQPVEVTYLGVSPLFSPNKAPLPGIPDRYVLFVGRRGNYKDYRVAVEAVAGLRDDVVLIAVGGGPFSSDELRLHGALGVSRRVLHLDVDDSGLAHLYSNALAFVYPSRYEGFGLPTLEAMASGTPAVLASASVHPEIGGIAGLYFPPGDADALRDLLDELLGDATLRERHIELGVQRASEFTWLRTATQTAEAYSAVAR